MVRQYALVGITTQIYTHADRPAYADQVKAKAIHDACCFDSSPLSTYRSLREKFHSGIAGPWWQGYHNQKVNNLLEQAWGTPDDMQRQKLYRRAYRIIRDDAAWIFLYNPNYLWGVNSRAQGWKAGIDGSIRLA
jgi:peptide/nickel transport system substrate-binding protein